MKIQINVKRALGSFGTNQIKGIISSIINIEGIFTTSNSRERESYNSKQIRKCGEGALGSHKSQSQQAHLHQALIRPQTERQLCGC